MLKYAYEYQTRINQNFAQIFSNKLVPCGCCYFFLAFYLNSWRRWSCLNLDGIFPCHHISIKLSLKFKKLTQDPCKKFLNFMANSNSRTKRSLKKRDNHNRWQQFYYSLIDMVFCANQKSASKRRNFFFFFWTIEYSKNKLLKF